jgi:cytoskeletal protein CcmA (bactofilin family)
MAVKTKVNGESTGTAINIIGSSTEIKGDITAKGDIRIDGKIFGNISTESKLIIGQSGYVEGEIKAKIADISGKVKGKLFATELVALRETSDFNGELTTDKLLIEQGAVFNGTCTMKTQQTVNAKSAK